jgi:hypothetical protein
MIFSQFLVVGGCCSLPTLLLEQLFLLIKIMNSGLIN